MTRMVWGQGGVYFNPTNTWYDCHNVIELKRWRGGHFYDKNLKNYQLRILYTALWSPFMEGLASSMRGLTKKSVLFFRIKDLARNWSLSRMGVKEVCS